MGLIHHIRTSLGAIEQVHLLLQLLIRSPCHIGAVGVWLRILHGSCATESTNASALPHAELGG